MSFRLPKQLQWRLAVQSGLAVLLAILAAYFIQRENIIWSAVAALLVTQASKGTPANQGLVILFRLVLALLAGFLLYHYINQPQWLILLVLGFALMMAIVLQVNCPDDFQTLMAWGMPPVLLAIATLYIPANEMVLASRIMTVMMGGAIGILCRLLVFPDVHYNEFRNGLKPLFNALIHYSDALQHFLNTTPSNSDEWHQLHRKMDELMQTLCTHYPEWVFATGFNRNLRASFRYVLVQLERITEAFFSLDYHARMEMDPEIREEVAPHLQLVVSKNAELLQIMRAFFAGEAITENTANFTSDVTDVRNSLQRILPASIELLDVTPQYISLAAMARDLVDIRELLLAMLSGLPIDDLAVTE